MLLKIKLLLLILLTYKVDLVAQTTPLRSFSLKIEQTEIPIDSSGVTLFYSVALIANDDIDITNVKFKLKSISTDSLINAQTFNIPQTNGVYQTGYFSSGLIKDGKAIYILLGNIKSKENLMLSADIIDDKNKTYLNLTTTE